MYQLNVSDQREWRKDRAFSLWQIVNGPVSYRQYAISGKAIC